MKKIPVLHPFLFAVYPTLFLFASNIGQISSYDVIFLPLGITLSFSLLLLCTLIFFFKDIHKAGFLVSLFLFLFFSYGFLRDILKGIFIFWPLVFIIGVYSTYKIKESIPNVTRILNVIGTVLVLLPLLQIGTFELKAIRLPIGAAREIVIKDTSKDKSQKKDLPNIFFIVLDAYARADVLQEIYHYDNSDFLEFLTQNGFFIPTQSVSNYSKTYLTLASCFNLNYLEDPKGNQTSIEPQNLQPSQQNKIISLPRKQEDSKVPLGEVTIDSQDLRPLHSLFQHSRVLSFFRKQGYSIVSLSSGKKGTGITKADIHLEGLILNDFQTNLINTTPLPDLLKIFKTANLSDWYRNRILHIFETLTTICEREKPLFVFAYLMPPHPPFVFGPNGKERYFEEKINDADGNHLIKKGRLTREQYIKGYRDQLIFVNNKMKEVITEILSKSKKPPIIVILGDHGPRSTFHWSNPDLTYMKECMTNLISYYLPHGGTSLLDDEESPINIFRVILNHYFGFNYELLENRCYFTPLKHHYRFYNVSDRVKNPNNGILHFHLGLASERQRHYDDAAYHYNEALSIDSESASIHNQLGICLAIIGKTDEAVFHFREALRINPDHTPAHNNLKRALKTTETKKNVKN